MKKIPDAPTFFSQVDNAEFHAALGRIALTADGMVLYRGLQKALYDITRTTDSGALLIENGRRRFAHELADIMAQSIAESGSAGRSSELGRPVVYVTGARPTGGDLRRPGDRRVDLAPGDGFYDPDFHTGPSSGSRRP